MSNTVKQKGKIYDLAKLAKERLIHNSYNTIKSKSINNAATFANFIAKHKKEDVPPTSNCSKEKLNYDDELYKKVCNIIESKNFSNPISCLIDKSLFTGMDIEAKQFYLKSLTEKYRHLRSRYYKEHPISFLL